MPRNGSGTYTPPSNSVSPAVFDTVISPEDFNEVLTDVAEALTGSIAADGQTAPTQNLPMSGYRHVGVDNGVLVTDYAALGQAQGMGYSYGGVTSGTSAAIIINLTPAPALLTPGMRISALMTTSNATSATINLNATGPIGIKEANGFTDLPSGTLVSGNIAEFIYDGASWRYQGDGTAGASIGLILALGGD